MRPCSAWQNDLELHIVFWGIEPLLEPDWVVESRVLGRWVGLALALVPREVHVDEDGDDDDNDTGRDHGYYCND